MTEPASSNDLIPIESKTKTIQMCFRQCLYEVPNFQRPYSWANDQLEDFWQDAVMAQGDFFFGSTVTWISQKRELFNATYSIIDGQQRLTTSTIILSVIRDALNKVGEEAKDKEPEISSAAIGQAATTQQYLVVRDDNGESYPVLTRPEDMFHEHIQNPSAIPSGAKWNASAERIGAARRFFETKILGELENLSSANKVERLKAIRSNVLKARVIQVELSSEEDGFLIFETLNTRGADLRLSDLVKNLLIRGGAKEVRDRSSLAKRWDRTVDRVQDGRTSQDVVDRFIWQSWNSRRNAVKEPELFKAISRHVGNDSKKHISYLEELEEDSLTYEWLEFEQAQVQAASRGERKAMAVPEFVDSVRALAIFNVSVANSTILAIARKYQNTGLLPKSQLIKAIRLVESFHFQFTALTSSGSTGGTRSRYNRFAVSLEEASSRQEVTRAIDDLQIRLKSSLPDRAAAVAAFKTLFYAPSLRLNEVQKPRARKMFIAYVLMAFAKWHDNIPAGVPAESWSIEHVKPQSQASGDFKDPVYSIGNLAIMTSALNGSIGELPLSRKMPEIGRGAAYVDSELKSWADSGEEVPSDLQIATRAAKLADEAMDKVWAL